MAGPVLLLRLFEGLGPGVIVGDFLEVPLLQIGERQLLGQRLHGGFRLNGGFGLGSLPAADRAATRSFLGHVGWLWRNGSGFGSGRLGLGVRFPSAGFPDGLFRSGFIVGQIFAKNRVQFLVLHQFGVGIRLSGKSSPGALESGFRRGS